MNYPVHFIIHHFFVGFLCVFTGSLAALQGRASTEQRPCVWPAPWVKRHPSSASSTSAVVMTHRSSLTDVAMRCGFYRRSRKIHFRVRSRVQLRAEFFFFQPYLPFHYWQSCSSNSIWSVRALWWLDRALNPDGQIEITHVAFTYLISCLSHIQ